MTQTEYSCDYQVYGKSIDQKEQQAVTISYSFNEHGHMAEMHRKLPMESIAKHKFSSRDNNIMHGNREDLFCSIVNPLLHPIQ